MEVYCVGRNGGGWGKVVSEVWNRAGCKITKEIFTYWIFIKL